MNTMTLEIVEFTIIERNISKQMIEIFISNTLDSMRKEDDMKNKIRFSEVIISGINSKKIVSALEDISIWNKVFHKIAESLLCYECLHSSSR